MVIFDFFHFSFEIVGLLDLFYLLLLFCDDAIGFLQNHFNFFFMGIIQGRVKMRIAFILGVKVEDNFCQLCNFLLHFVVGLLGGASCLCCHF